MPIKDLFTEFNETGICKIDVTKVCSKWTDKMSISQYHDEFSFVKFDKGSTHSKVSISREQADEIIKKAKLYRISSSTFNFACSYKKEDVIISEIKRFEEMIEERKNEIRVIEKEKMVYSEALFCKINDKVDD